MMPIASVWILTEDMFGPGEFEILGVFASREAAEKTVALQRNPADVRYKITEHVVHHEELTPAQIP